MCRPWESRRRRGRPPPSRAPPWPIRPLFRGSWRRPQGGAAGQQRGCANADAVGLNRREREHCDDVFGAQAKGRTFDAPLDPAKQREFEAQALRQQALRNYWNSPTVGVDHRNRDNPGKGKDIPGSGRLADGLGRERSAESQALKRLSDAEKAEERRKKAAREAEGGRIGQASSLGI